MHFRRHRHGPRWEAFAEKIREQINEGGWSASWGGERPGGRGRPGGGPRGRVLDSAELRLVLLKLIWEEPRHGYELIKAIEALSGGVYAPSPGMVYPTLTLLADQGLVEESADGSRKRFAINDAGAQLLGDEAAAVAAAIARLEDLAKLATRPESGPVRRAMRNLHTALHTRISQQDGDDAVRRALQLDIAAILDEAAARIERL
ncbi:MAG: PadR family transcriptional regulator [Alphaproteobacteria bacterium PA4]|nr:MAG: PadR family transcriptional regulator [Alphaproteobacteria bacterium PA4]